MAGRADFACAILTAPATALVAIVAAALAALLGGEPLAGKAMFAGLAAFVVVAPATSLLRARTRRLRLDWACLLLCVTLVAMAATVAAIVIAMSFAYACFMRGF